MSDQILKDSDVELDPATIPDMPPPLNSIPVDSVAGNPVEAPQEAPKSDSDVTEASDSIEDIIEKIVPQVDPVEVTLTYGEHSEVYVQKTLSVFNRLEFTKLLSNTIKDLVDGPDGVNVDAIFGDSAPSTVDELKNTELGELNTFVQAIANIAAYTPDFLREAFIIALNVPHNQKAFAYLALDEISDDLFEQILTTFIDQNYKEIENLFTERAPRIFRRVVALRDQS